MRKSEPGKGNELKFYGGRDRGPRPPPRTGVQDLQRRKGWSDADGGCGDGHTRLLGLSFWPLKVPREFSLPPKGIQLPLLSGSVLPAGVVCLPHGGVELERNQGPPGSGDRSGDELAASQGSHRALP